MKKTSIFNTFSVWAKVLLFISLLLLIVVAFNALTNRNSKEGFEQKDEFTFKEGPEVYDNFYADIYDHLVYSQLKDQYEIGEIINSTNPTEESIILDIGCGTGHHVALMGKQGHQVTGVDISDAMVKKAKENYPEENFIKGDAMNSQLFSANSYTHIFCLYFSIYYFKDKDRFFANCMKWLMPGGFLVVHLVERDMFDPILPPANPLFLVSPQKYAKDRITQSKVVFNNMEYVANFHLDKSKDTASFNEKFKDRNSGKTRKNKHIFYMEPDKSIVVRAKNAGFILQGKIDLLKVGYEYQYLYIFVKPN